MEIRIKTHITPKMRIISFVLAFVMVFVGLPYMGQDLVVLAETTVSSSISDISGGSKTAEVITDSQIVTGNGTYIGGYLPSAVTLFDYYSDNELRGVDIYSNAVGYTDPYKALNFAISDDIDTNSPATDEITFIYKTIRSGVTSVRIHLLGSNRSTEWPGYSMDYEPISGEYRLTMKYADIKDGSNVHFDPTGFIINGYDAMSTSSKRFQTDNIYHSMSAGKSYSFEDFEESSGTAG